MATFKEKLDKKKLKKTERKQKIKFKKAKDLTTQEVTRALNAASMSIDGLQAQVASMRRMIITERAQVIYYTDQALAFCRRETVAVTVIGFADLEDPIKEAYVKKAILELEGDQTTVPHTAGPAGPEGGKLVDAHGKPIIH
jgi:predicted ribosome-associated RNA-binding protein Tma20